MRRKPNILAATSTSAAAGRRRRNADLPGWARRVSTPRPLAYDTRSGSQNASAGAGSTVLIYRDSDDCRRWHPFAGSRRLRPYWVLVPIAVAGFAAFAACRAGRPRSPAVEPPSACGPNVILDPLGTPRTVWHGRTLSLLVRCERLRGAGGDARMRPTPGAARGLVGGSTTNTAAWRGDQLSLINARIAVHAADSVEPLSFDGV
jgi:hypothetical protein